MRPMLNCWIVALWFWFASHCRAYLWMRRSMQFRGIVLHAGVAVRSGWRVMRFIEYVPPKSALWTARNIGILFNGRYRVWELRVVRRRSFRTMRAARAHLKE